MQTPLLSICIPTYNRAGYLEKSLNSLVEQDGFSQVEVVISDNASTDATADVCRKFTEQYPNIFYYRNEENIQDRNFPTALMKAHGKFRKLYNDNINYLNGAIKFLLETVSGYERERPFIFFLNNNIGAKKIKNSEKVEDMTFDEFVLCASYFLTWIGAFGFWEEECDNLEKNFDSCNLNLWQTCRGLEIASQKKSIIILTRLLTKDFPITKKNIDYNWHTVFFKNFPLILEDYVDAKRVSKKTFRAVKRDMLFKYVPWLKNALSENRIVIENPKALMNRIYSDYRQEPYYLFFRISLIVKKLDFRRKILLTLKQSLRYSRIGNKLITIKRKIGLKLY